MFTEVMKNTLKKRLEIAGLFYGIVFLSTVLYGICHYLILGAAGLSWAVSASFFCFFVLVSCMTGLQPWREKRILSKILTASSWIIWCIFWCFTISHAAFYRIENRTIASSDVYAIIAHWQGEGRDLLVYQIQMNAVFFIIFAVFLLGILGSVIFIRQKKTSKSPVMKIMFPLFLGAAVLFSGFSSFFPVVFCKMFVVEFKKYKQLTGLGKLSASATEESVRKYVVGISNDPVTCILVIGESATRNYMNCYGYPIRNTPFATSKLNDKNWLFVDAYACSTMTSFAIPEMLSFHNQYMPNAEH